MSREGVIVAGGWNCRRRAWSGLWGCAESLSPDKITLPRRLRGVGAYVSGGSQAGESDGS